MHASTTHNASWQLLPQHSFFTNQHHYWPTIDAPTPSTSFLAHPINFHVHLSTGQEQGGKKVWGRYEKNMTRLGFDPRTLSVTSASRGSPMLTIRDNQLHHPANHDYSRPRSHWSSQLDIGTTKDGVFFVIFILCRSSVHTYMYSRCEAWGVLFNIFFLWIIIRSDRPGFSFHGPTILSKQVVSWLNLPCRVMIWAEYAEYAGGKRI